MTGKLTPESLKDFMDITVISSNFPHPRFPQSGAFVNNLAHGWANGGEQVQVYVPISQTHFLLKRRAKPVELFFHEKVQVQYLKYFSFGNSRFLGLDAAKFGFRLAHNKVEKAFLRDREARGNPTVLYGKFLMSGASHAALLAKKYKVPAIADLGESQLTQRLSHGQIIGAGEILKFLSGVVCVSPRLEREVIELGMDPSKILMVPNAADANRFFAIPQKSARRILGLPPDKKIVIFVGHFIDRKGPSRVLAAVETLTQQFKCIFIGSGPIKLKSSRILFQGQVRHDQLNLWLNAADVFCLPTFAEGSCNALAEAKEVGLPIVTSDIRDITDFEGASEYFLVSPKAISEIAGGIESASIIGRCHYTQRSRNNSDRARLISAWMDELLRTA